MGVQNSTVSWRIDHHNLTKSSEPRVLANAKVLKINIRIWMACHAPVGQGHAVMQTCRTYNKVRI